MSSTADMLLRRLRMLIDRALLTRVSYRDNVRVLQISPRAGQAFDGIEHIEPYGFTSHPLEGAEAIVANLGGNSGRAIVLLVNDRRHRIVIDESETAIYTANGEIVHLKNDGSIHVKASVKVFIEAPLTEISQQLLVTGNAHFKANVQVDGNWNVNGTSHSIGAFTTDGDVVAGGISVRYHHHSGTGGPLM